MDHLILIPSAHETSELSVIQGPYATLPIPKQQEDVTRSYNMEGEVTLVESEQTLVIICQTIVLLIFCMFGTLANSLVFWVFNRRPALRSLSNRFVLSLVTANILISSIIAPLMLFEAALNEYILLSCVNEIISVLSSSVIFSAIFSTLLIAMDRFYAVTSPLHYSMTITRSRSQVMIMTAWVGGTILALPYITFSILPMDNRLHRGLQFIFIVVQIVLGYLVPFTGLCWLYMRMYNAAHRNSERTRQHSISGELLTVMDGSTTVIPPHGMEILTNYVKDAMPVNNELMVNGNSTSTPCANGAGVIQAVNILTKKQRRRSSSGSSSSLLFREEGRAIKTALLVLVSFLICWTPHFSCIFFKGIDQVQSEFENLIPPPWNGNETWNHFLFQPMEYRIDTDWVRFFGLFGILLSCLLNPFIYVFRNKMACKEVTKVLCRFLEKKQEEQPSRTERFQPKNDSGTLSVEVGNDEYQPKYAPCIGKSPKRSSLKSLTPQSSLTSTGTNAIIDSPVTPVNGIKPPFLRSMTVPEQSQPRVKFPPNLIRQKSYVQHSVTEFSSPPSLCNRAKFVRQDSVCSTLSNDSVLMICSQDRILSISESRLLRGGISTFESRGSSSASSNYNPPLPGEVSPIIPALQKHYLRQDSSFSDKTQDSGILSMSSAKPSANNSPSLHRYPRHQHSHEQPLLHHEDTHHRKHNHCMILQTSI